MLTVLDSSLPKLPFYLLFTMDFLSQLSSKVIALPPMVSAVMQLFCWWWYWFVRAIALADNKMISRVAVGAKWRIEVMRRDSVAGSRCTGWQPMSGQNHPGRLLSDHIVFTRLYCLLLGVRGKCFHGKEEGHHCQKSPERKIMGLCFFTICL